MSRENDIRTARLLFGAELAQGVVTPEALSASDAVSAMAHVGAVPSKPRRVLQQLRYKAGRLDFEAAVIEPLLEARKAVLGDAAYGPPRFLIRVDEFPHARAWEDSSPFGTERFERFHEILAGEGIPYLIAVLPRVSREPLSPKETDTRPLLDSELEMLRRIAGEGVCFGLHGHDHRTRHASPRRHSELCGLSLPATEELLEEGLAELGCHDIHPDVFVPPYNRFDAEQYAPLQSRFSVVCGGPESIGLMGFHRSPQWRGDAVYLPSYAPLYERSELMQAAVERSIDGDVGLWLPMVLHWGWEDQDDWQNLRRLVKRLARYAAHWEDFQATVKNSAARTTALANDPMASGSARSGSARGRGARL